jgi:hypothetical protein
MDKYDDLQAKYCELLYEPPVREYHKKNKSGVPVKPPIYWFELLLVGPMKWNIYNLTPTAEYAEAILPHDIIEKISEALVDPDKVITMKGVRSAVMNKTVDLQFVCISGTYIVGTVTDTSREHILWKHDMIGAYDVFNAYKRVFPEDVNRFMNDFVSRLDPGWSWQPPYPEPRPEPRRQPVDTEYRPLEIRRTNLQVFFDGYDVNVNGLLALSRNPEFNKWLWLKLEELKNIFSEDIDAYKTAKAHYRKALLADLKVEEGKRPPYWFEFTKYAPASWFMTKLDPMPPVFEPRHEAIPYVMLKMMLQYEPNPAVVRTVSSQLPDPVNRSSDFRWVFYSSNCLMGVIHEGDINGLVIPERCFPSAKFMPLMEEMALHLRLHRFMYGDPKVVETFIDEFTVKLLPALREKRLLRG